MAPENFYNQAQISSRKGGASVQHGIGQLLGHALNALPGYSTLGSNITNPNVNYLGANNPPTPSNNYWTPRTASATTPATTTVLGEDNTTQQDTTQQQADYDRLLSGFNTQKSNIFGSSRDVASGYAGSRQSSILDFIDNLRSEQRTIDERGIQNELAKKQGYGSILDMVGRGLRSGGTMLANRNASDSSASDALARAYGDIGRRQLSSIGNQYELENRNIGMEQEDFGRQRATGLRKFDEDKVQKVNDIAIYARDRLAQLDADMVEASMTERIQIEQEKNAIKSEVMDILSQYDQQLAQGAAGVQPTSLESRRQEAFGLANAGNAATNPFDFTSQVPAQFQGTGPFASQLPLFTFPRTRREA